MKRTMDRLYAGYLQAYRKSPETFFQNRRDPILFPHRYKHFHDIEISGFLATTFAYGNVSSLCAFVEKLHGLLQPSPHEFLRQGPDHVNSLARHKVYYRLHKSEEILSLLRMLAAVYATRGSLAALFMESYDKNSTMKQMLTRFVRRLQDVHGSPVPFLIPSPESGSPCKRLNLFLRWMVRRDGIDFGLWKEVAPAQLIMPVDTHIGRIAYRLGWIQTPSLSWQKAEAITAALREFDSADPTRYDFALCHESIARSPRLKKLMIERNGKKLK